MIKEPLQYTINKDGINEVVEESGKMVTMLRQVAWNNKEEKLELRKWIVDVDKEQPMKGCSMTDVGWHACTNILVHNGFGHTRELIRDLSTRDDFETSLISIIGKKKVEETKEKESIEEDDYFTPTKDNLGL